MGFYVIEKSTGNEWVSNVTRGPVISYTTDIDYAVWSTESYKVQNLIDSGSIQGVSVTLKNGNHPTQKPPL